MKLLKQKFPTKTREQVEKEMDDVFSGKDKSGRAKMLKKAAFAMKAFKTKEEIKQVFVEEYIKKYGELSSGKTSLNKIKKEVGLIEKSKEKNNKKDSKKENC